jgi:peroxiredoxin
MIQVGERIPEAMLTTMTKGTPRGISTAEIFAGKRVVLFAVPGAFTPTCSDHHLPGFIERADEVKAMGVDLITCVAVNDVFVVEAWRRDREVGDRILMLADGNGDFARAMGLEIDSSRFGMGLRSRRYAAIVEDGVVKALKVEQPGQLEVSTVESVLTSLGALEARAAAGPQ